MYRRASLLQLEDTTRSVVVIERNSRKCCWQPLWTNVYRAIHILITPQVGKEPPIFMTTKATIIESRPLSLMNEMPRSRFRTPGLLRDPRPTHCLLHFSVPYQSHPPAIRSSCLCLPITKYQDLESFPSYSNMKGCRATGPPAVTIPIASSSKKSQTHTITNKDLHNVNKL